MKNFLPTLICLLLITILLASHQAIAGEKEDLLLGIQSKNTAKVKEKIEANAALIKTLLIGRAEDGRPIKAIPLYWAARDGSLDMVEFLLSQGSDINTTNSLGFSPLHAAVGKARKDAVSLLISRGASASTREIDFGFTPLHTAAGRGYLELVRFLLDAGADINARGLQNGPCTPLDFLIGRLYLSNEPYSPARFETIKLLRSRGAQCAGNYAQLPDLKGEILDSSDIQRLICTISLGSNDGMAPGDIVSIQRGGSELTIGKVARVENSSSTVSIASAPAVLPGRGDTVMLQKKGPTFAEAPSGNERQDLEMLTTMLQRHREQVSQYLERTTLP